MADSAGFILNVNPPGTPDRIHDAGNLTERCNTDDALDKQSLDYATGKRLLETSRAEDLEPCKHCMRELRG